MMILTYYVIVINKQFTGASKQIVPDQTVSRKQIVSDQSAPLGAV